MRAAVLRAYHQPLTIEDIQIDDPGPREVRIRTAACGVCHSDLHVLEGALPVPPPCVLGHEPAGVVLAVGRDVTYVKPGDHVIGCLSAYCGACDFCLRGEPNLCGGAATLRARDAKPRLSKGKETIFQMAHLSAFAEEMLVPETAVVKIDPEMPLDRAALIGCGVTTGVGAALNTAKVRPGDTVAVIGCGGVGLSAIQGARIGGASRIVAVDTAPWKLELAMKLGATEGIDVSAGDPVAQLHAKVPGGVDYAFECIGTPGTCRQAVLMARKGGAAVFVGVVPAGVDVPLLGLDIVLQGKRILGSMMGDNRFRIDMPKYVGFYLDGRLKLDEMISGRIKLDEINQAFADMKAGKVARQVITFG